MVWAGKFSLVLFLNICKFTQSNPFNGNDGSLLTLGKILHPDLKPINYDLAKKLCKATKENGIPNLHRFLWTKVDDQNDNLAVVNDADNTKAAPDCLKFTWTPCVGKSRFPLAATCGFFNIESTCTNPKGKPEGEQSVEAPIVIDNARAMELCLGLQRSEERLNPNKKINYVPFRLDVDQKEYPSLYCLGWKWFPCQSAAASSSSACDVWEMDIHSGPNCKDYRQTLEGYQNYTKLDVSGVATFDNELAIMDFVQDPESNDLKYEENSGLQLIEELISCQRNGPTISCHIMPPPPKGGRSKRESEQTMEGSTGHTNYVVRRTKRQCCDWEFCGPCGGLRYSGRGYGYQPHHLSRTIICTCGIGCNRKPPSCSRALYVGTSSCGDFCDIGGG